MEIPASARPFARHHRRYDRWFERHRAAYVSELLAVRALLPTRGRGLEIGVGSGRFAAPLGVAFGVDPATEMLGYARNRGVAVACAVAGALPFPDSTFDHVLVVTTLCFVDDPRTMLREAARVLRPGGTIVIGMIDGESAVGRLYRASQRHDPFYRVARFYSSADVEALLAEAGFGETAWMQTLAAAPAVVAEIEPARQGRGHGAFLVVRAACTPPTSVGDRRAEGG
jgi:SAM-dependent methyltransferase